jgi:serine/threonine-protein kinase
VPLLEPGQIVRGTYEVERYLGEGAFAEVYRVRHRFLGRQALKVFKRVGMSIEDIEGMLGEAIMLSRIGHPNIVRVFDANVLETTRGLYGYFTMENVAGGSLDKFWRSYGEKLVPVEMAVNLMKQVCRGLCVAHGAKPPIIHRDIKPQNILVGCEIEGLRARVSDFGLAKQVNPLTLLATAAGTLAFKPPEVFGEERSDSCAGDVWAIGATLYLLLTDQLPYDGPNSLKWDAQRSFDSKIRPAACLNPDVNDKLDFILAKALEVDPGRRYQSAFDVLGALEEWRSTESTRLPKAAAIGSEGSKLALGKEHSPQNRDEAERMATHAISLMRDGRLNEAADLMEEAFNKWPELREKYSYQVRLWRSGISM